MKRRDFIKICGLLGISFPSFGAKPKNDAKHSQDSDNVLIIGSGAAGIAAGYLLEQQGVNYKILEASETYGGRMKRTTSFVDFPLPLGAEWLHVSEKELAKIVNKNSKAITTQLKEYSGREAIGYYENGSLSYSALSEVLGSDFSDKKFINSSWFDFFDEYIVPHIRKNIQLNTQIVSINYQGSRIKLIDAKGSRYEADKVIITVPLKVLQNNIISFVPTLTKRKKETIQEAPVWGGIKVFIEFAKRFYPAFLAFPDSITNKGQRTYFDAAFAQNTSSNVLGLFAVGEQAKPYQRLSHREQLAYILNELDQVFEGEASRQYKQHIVQDWSKEPFIQSAYLSDEAPSYISSYLFTPVKNKLFFAGESYTHEDDWGGVHNATRSARRVVEEIISLRME
ncbi:flavin monoamine oxidase family protein [Aliikangiella coralliicola]|uniref:Tryptophan 2-monooxygenase n=1 Tax=Aliikangiella coralliicola TaxID=2592383 RepID=A0A545UIJ3_9GAMM|nr:FAD-dependent oxidoreductase [Aliikangiella coralliicola]TQV89286.1 FAD-dependent oxidoreductase [Aliikangiella coralliicola]